MATTKNPISYETTATGKVPYTSVMRSDAYNASRDGCGGLLDLLGCNDKGRPDSKTMELLDLMIQHNFDSNREALVTTTIGLNAKSTVADLKVLDSQWEKTSEEWAQVSLGKGLEWPFVYKGVNLMLSSDDLVKEHAIGCPKPTAKTELLMAGNRRSEVKVILDAIIRKAGFVDDIVVEVNRVKVSYSSARARADHSIYLNEVGAAGKKESSLVQKYRACEKKVKAGAAQSELTVLFPGKGGRGNVQRFWALLFAIKMLLWFMPEKAAELATAFRTGKAPILKQGKPLAYINGLINRCTHDNGHTEAFAEAGPGTRKANGVWTDHKLKSATKIKAYLASHPTLIDELLEGITGISDPKWVIPGGKAPTAKSVASSTMTNIAADAGHEGVQTLLQVLAGEDKTMEPAEAVSAVTAQINELLAKVASLTIEVKELKAKIRSLAAPVKVRVKGNLSGRPITQDDFDKFVAANEKKASSRNKRSG